MKILTRLKHKLLKHWGAEILTEDEKAYLGKYRYRKMEELQLKLSYSVARKMDESCAELLFNAL
jgi:hypothetical protein